MISMDKQYKTRDGQPVRLLCVDRPGAFPVVGLVGEDIETWSGFGSWEAITNTDLDLIEIKPAIRVERWINIVKYPEDKGPLLCTLATKKEAEEAVTRAKVLARAIHFVWEGEEQ